MDFRRTWGHKASAISREPSSTVLDSPLERFGSIFRALTATSGHGNESFVRCWVVTKLEAGAGYSTTYVCQFQDPFLDFAVLPPHPSLKHTSLSAVEVT